MKDCLFVCVRVCLSGRECLSVACVLVLLPYLITACKKTITSRRITTFCTLHGGFEMEPSFSSLFSLISISVSVLHFRPYSPDMEYSHSHSASRYVCAALLVLTAALHAYMVSTISKSAVKVCKDSCLIG